MGIGLPELEFEMKLNKASLVEVIHIFGIHNNQPLKKAVENTSLTESQIT